MRLKRIYGIVNAMKALKSPLASRLLADPKAREQLRNFLTGTPSSANASQQAPGDPFEIRAENGEVVHITIVPKARAA